MLPSIAFDDPDAGIQLHHGDCLAVLDALIAARNGTRFDVVFADPPYFLSNGGTTCRSGRRVPVHKGDWDESGGARSDHRFNVAWLKRCRRLLDPDGTLWVSGTFHVIHSLGHALQQLGFKLLNDITWEKPNPPPNLACRCFTHSTETLLWAARSDASKHTFNYELMRAMSGGVQMKTVWSMPGPAADEKLLGEHPTQKPVHLVTRCLLAATQPGDTVLDPFLGSGTTAIACLRTGRRCVGIEAQRAYLDLAVARIRAELAQGAQLLPFNSESHPTPVQESFSLTE